MDQLIGNDYTVSDLQYCIAHGALRVSMIPGLLKAVIRQQCWRERIVAVTKQHATFEHFAEFVAKQPPEGLGTDIATLKRLCRDDPEAIEAIDRAEQRPRGTNQYTEGVDNINTLARPDGTSEQYAIRRLRKDRPDLLDRVLTGELSPHAAAVEAGFRERKLQIPPDPLRAAQALAHHFTPEQLEQLIDHLARLLPAAV